MKAFITALLLQAALCSTGQSPPDTWESLPLPPVTWNLGQDFPGLMGCQDYSGAYCRFCKDSRTEWLRDSATACQYSEVWGYHFREDAYDTGLYPGNMNPVPMTKSDLKRWGSAQGVRLKKKYIAQFLTILGAPDQESEELPKLCIFAPHHALVVYDSKGRIRIWIAICRRCDEITSYPWMRLDAWKLGELLSLLYRVGLR